MSSISQTHVTSKELRKFSQFHLVELRPWPILSSIGRLNIVLTGILLMNRNLMKLPFLSFVALTLIALAWWRDIHREASLQGLHPQKVIAGLKTGILLFIVSEVFFFISFFWAFLHRRLSPVIELGQNWPPSQIQSFNPIGIPLLNTILLLSSGVSITWSHHEMIKGNFKKANTSLLLTIALGLTFSFFQAFEYVSSPFSISDSAYGSTFFMATGFHGIHVIIGSTFLLISKKRLETIATRKIHITGFECAAWYWHFVDVVWLFLYTLVYWWGS